MILGLGHIVFTVRTSFLETCVKNAILAGCRLRFRHDSLENSWKSKEKIVGSGKLSDTMNMVFLDTPLDGLPLEVITNDTVQEKLNYQVKVGEHCPSANEMFCDKCPVRLEDMLLSGTRPDSKFNIIYISTNTASFERSVAFWTGFLGFSTIMKNEVACLLKKKTLSAKWHGTVLLKKIPAGHGNQMQNIDSEGPSCLSFISSNIGHDFKMAEDKGARPAGGTEFITVNGKPLAIAFFNAPGGELMELVQILN
jgi:catechol 2,3-dioxygenase-like lactoylglutathione lyase family enzyme